MFEIISLVFSAVVAAGLLTFAAIALCGSAVGLAVGTPLFIIFSPILLPAGIATALLAVTLSAGGGSGLSAAKIIIRIIKKIIELSRGGVVVGSAAASPASTPASASG